MDMKIQVPSISIEDAIKKHPIFIDVRTPKEFEHFRIEDALHVPLFLNEEHADVGTIYRQKGKEEAKVIGLELFSNKLPDLYQQFKNIQQTYKDRLIIVYCWRGGMRSKGIVSVMSGLGIPVAQLKGGIRSYREWIMKEIEAEQFKNKPFIVLSGNTGTSKTNILSELSQKGYPVIDLEGLANHRGSVFGHIGKKPNNQKQFEYELFKRLQTLKHAPYYIIEAESKRIGKIHLPDVILSGKNAGIMINIEADIQYRIKTICETYPLEKYYDQFSTALSSIEKRLPLEIANKIRVYLEDHKADKIVELLLKHYYDPRYLHSAKQYDTPVHTIKIDSLQDGIDKVEQAIHHICELHHIMSLT